MYLAILMWLVLFKFSYDPVGVIRDYGARNINLIPFLHGHRLEMIENLIVFVPFGLMLEISDRSISSKRKLAIILASSVLVEIIQFILAIGVSDVTDVIMNTLGGLLGLGLYRAAIKIMPARNVDVSVVTMLSLGVIAVLYLRIFVFIVRY